MLYFKRSQRVKSWPCQPANLASLLVWSQALNSSSDMLRHLIADNS